MVSLGDLRNHDIQNSIENVENDQLKGRSDQTDDKIIGFKEKSTAPQGYEIEDTSDLKILGMS